MKNIPFGNQVFSYYFERVTWAEAITRCTANNQRLLTIDSPEIQAAVEAHLRTIGMIGITTVWDTPLAPGYWLAGRDVVTEGIWRWLDGRQIPTRPGEPGYQNWYRQGGLNEPNAGSAGEDCLYANAILDASLNGRVIYPDILGGWFDGECTRLKYFICQSDASE